MKIAFLAYDKPGYHGGPIVIARRLLPELVNRGHEVHALILYHQGESPTADYLSRRGVVVHVHAWQRYTEQNILWLLTTLQPIQPDVFVPNLSVAGWYAARWLRKAGIPGIAVMHSSNDYHRGMIDEFVCGDHQWAISGLVCVSQLLLNQVADRHPLYTKLRFIPSGIPLPLHVAKHEQGVFRIAYIGRLVNEAKRILDLIDALVPVLKNLPYCRVTLFGEAENKEFQEKISNKISSTGHSDQFECAGAIAPEELHNKLINYHVVVLLSDYEGTPGGVMDGMACGLVPVCLDIPGGMRELVVHNKTGILVQNRGDDFFNAIINLENNLDLRIRLAVNAKNHIEKYYSLKVAADKWEDIFSELKNMVSKKQDIAIPSSYNLPPVLKSLAREDRRQPSMFRLYVRGVIMTLAWVFKRNKI